MKGRFFLLFHDRRVKNNAESGSLVWHTIAGDTAARRLHQTLDNRQSKPGACFANCPGAVFLFKIIIHSFLKFWRHAYAVILNGDGKTLDIVAAVKQLQFDTFSTQPPSGVNLIALAHRFTTI